MSVKAVHALYTLQFFIRLLFDVVLFINCKPLVIYSIIMIIGIPVIWKTEYLK